MSHRNEDTSKVVIALNICIKVETLRENSQFQDKVSQASIASRYRIIYAFLIFHTRATYSIHVIINDLIISVHIKFVDEYEIRLTTKDNHHFSQFLSLRSVPIDVHGEFLAKNWKIMPTNVAVSVGLAAKTKSVIALWVFIKSNIENFCPFN